MSILFNKTSHLNKEVNLTVKSPSLITNIKVSSNDKHPSLFCRGVGGEEETFLQRRRQMQEVDIPDIFDVLEGGEDENAVKFLLGFAAEEPATGEQVSAS